MDDIAIITPIQAQTAPGMSTTSKFSAGAQSSALTPHRQLSSDGSGAQVQSPNRRSSSESNLARPASGVGKQETPATRPLGYPEAKTRWYVWPVAGDPQQAKIEDKERSKKRQLIDQRLQTKLRKETDSVRRAEEARKDKLNANRKEEDLQLKDSVVLQAPSRALTSPRQFLLTSDIIPTSSSDEDPSPLPPALASVQRGHPPPLYYLPAILTPAQESYIRRRKAQVLEAVDAEYAAFLQERSAGIEEISELRKAVASEEARKKSETEENEEPPSKEGAKDVEMEVDDRDSATMTSKDAEEELEKKEEPTPVPADGDDAVEY
ncbi:unnamed protein product [Mycena citricolor]|uniref:Pinin/SDK/MemA protein domain-containing protein n=1 Tax=Mycena citricolor TaxID=2018698 RepID=A0AAD2JXL7_9AGAR|nr:unnamed protein product [Mycena citricolor]